MEFGTAAIIGAFIRWLARGCKTSFQDELDCAGENHHHAVAHADDRPHGRNLEL